MFCHHRILGAIHLACQLNQADVHCREQGEIGKVFARTCGRQCKISRLFQGEAVSEAFLTMLRTLQRKIHETKRNERTAGLVSAIWKWSFSRQQGLANYITLFHMPASQTSNERLSIQKTTCAYRGRCTLMGRIGGNKQNV